MAVKCPKGHWYEPGDPDSAGECPQCAAQSPSAPPISDDDVLAIMSDSPEPAASASQSPDAGKLSSSSSILRRKKVCPECSHEASFSFVYCPRCGAPLKIASVELP